MISRKAIRHLFLMIAAVMLTISVSIAQKSEPKREEESDKKGQSAKPSKLMKYRSRSSTSSEDLKRASGKVADDAEGALDEVQEALAESIAQGNVLNEGKSYILIGDINTKISEWKLAVQNYEKAYNVLKPGYSTTNEFKTALQGLARANMEAGYHQVAINNYTELLSLNVTPEERRNFELALAEVYYRMGNYDESMKVANAIPQTRGKTADPEFQSQYQGLMARNYARKNDFDNTSRYLDSAVNTVRTSGAANAAPLEEAKEEVAGLLRDQNRLEDEIDLRTQSIQLNMAASNYAVVTKDKIELSKTLEAKGERSEALKELIEAVTLADTINDPHDQANAYLSLAGLYEKNGQNNNALDAYRKYSKAMQKVEAETSVKMQERSRIIQKQTDIEELSNSLYVSRSEDNAQKAMIQRQWFVIASLVVIILAIGITSVFIYRSAQARQKANQLLALKSLRSQMNPHFIFNALNSVNHFIAQQDERTANKFLSEFSQLMRLVLEYSQEDFITLQKEQEILTLYMKLEHYRFRDKFEYEIEIDESINAESIQVPPMLIQPYLENAVWHGLRYRDSVGFLKMSMAQRDHKLVVTITDNGIGRKKSAELKTENQKKHRSTGLKNIKERLQILNTVYRTHYDVKVSDGADGVGTIVEISLPVNNLK